jgi:cytochrome b
MATYFSLIMVTIDAKQARFAKIHKEFPKKFLYILSVLILANVSSFSVQHSESTIRLMHPGRPIWSEFL